MTATTVVCCSMISLSQTRYGSGVSPGSARHGKRRRWRSYQRSRRSAGAMADNDTNADMTTRRGIVHGPRPLGALVPAITRATYRRHSPAAAQIMADWPIIVGPKVASMTTPRKLDRGTLTIACAGAVAMDLHYVGVELINRINGHLGGQ